MDTNYLNSVRELLINRKNEAILESAHYTNEFDCAFRDGLIEGYNHGIRFLNAALNIKDEDPGVELEKLRGLSEAMDWINRCILGGIKG